MSQEKKSLKSAEELTLFPADSLVSRSPLQEQDQERVIQDICGPKCLESFAKLDHDGSWLKTYQGCCQYLMDGSLEKWSEVWPRAGMLLNGIAYRLPPLAPLTREIGSGFWLTPRASEPCEKPENFVKRMGDRGDHCRGSLSAQVMFPIPKASEHKGGYSSKGKSPSLGMMATHNAWPTPRASDGTKGPTTPERNAKRLGGISLVSAAKHSPTTIQKGGGLNPQFVEWLMGLPIGWTDLSCLETAKSFKLSSLSERK